MAKVEKLEKKTPHGGARPGAGRKPRGPGKVKYDLRMAAQDYSQAGLNYLISVIEDEEASTADKIRAVSMIWDRAHGRPEQAVAVDTPDDGVMGKAMSATTSLIEQLIKKAAEGGDDA